MKKLNNDVELIMLDKHNMKPLIDYINELQGYKERIEKAIEYLNNKDIYDSEYGEFIYYQYLIHDNLLNILRGEEK